jgi:hypothetical protein
VGFVIRIGTRVELRFDLETTYFVAAGRVRTINKHGRASVDWDNPRMQSGLVPVADLKRTKIKPAVYPKPSYPNVITLDLANDDQPELAWPRWP